MASTAGQQIESALVAMMHWATRETVRRRMLGEAARDLSATDVWLLGALEDLGPITSTELARLQGLDKSSVTAQVRRLERHGLVSRQSRSDDGRVVLLAANERGRQLRAEMQSKATALFDEALSSWSEEDRRTLGILFERLSRAVTSDEPTPPAPQHR